MVWALLYIKIYYITKLRICFRSDLEIEFDGTQEGLFPYRSARYISDL